MSTPLVSAIVVNWNGGSMLRDALASLFAQTWPALEVILVDTGPILGSVEAAVLAPEADGAILTIARGQNRWMARNAVQRLRALGVRTAGFVYNRAKPMDFHSSPFGSSAYSISTESNEHGSNGDSTMSQLVAEPTSKLKRFGPLVEAVAA